MTLFGDLEYQVHRPVVIGKSNYYNNLVTILQLKLLASLKGSSYQPGQVTDEELQDKLDELKTGMLMAFNYAQGTE